MDKNMLDVLKFIEEMIQITNEDKGEASFDLGLLCGLNSVKHYVKEIYEKEEVL